MDSDLTLVHAVNAESTPIGSVDQRISLLLRLSLTVIAKSRLDNYNFLIKYLARTI
jgi:hypothetical protein